MRISESFLLPLLVIACSRGIPLPDSVNSPVNHEVLQGKPGDAGATVTRGSARTPQLEIIFSTGTYSSARKAEEEFDRVSPRRPEKSGELSGGAYETAGHALWIRKGNSVLYYTFLPADGSDWKQLSEGRLEELKRVMSRETEDLIRKAGN